jgi:HK97 family phage portal protein
MRLLGYDITVTKAAAGLVPADRSSRRGWWPIVIHEPHTGAWQANLEEPVETVLAYPPVYACITRISGDMSKMGQAIVQETDDGIYVPVEHAPWTPVLRRPNPYQNRLQFVQWWMNSKLVHGNTYVLKARDGRGVVSALYILDPARVRVMMAPDGSVFYELKTDTLSTLTGTEAILVPARDIIHDRTHPLFHPLIGIAPLYAAWISALRGMRIERNSLEFFGNGAQPNGVLTAPGFISQEVADRAKQRWDEGVQGVAVLGDGLKYEPMTQSAVDSQLIDQEKFTAEFVCACFHMKPWMIGIGPAPNYTNVEAIQQSYLTDCLQLHITQYQAVLADGLELPRSYTVHFALEDLLQMDTATKMTVAVNGVGAGIFTPNEGRKKFNLPPKEGGDSPYLQQQYWSLEARGAQSAAVVATPETAMPAVVAPAEDDEDEDTLTTRAMVLTRKTWRGAA